MKQGGGSPARVEAKLEPCQALAASGFQCSGEGLLTALASDNRKAIDLYVDAGVNGSTIVSSPVNGEYPVWRRAAVADAPGLDHLLGRMEKAGISPCGKRSSECYPFEISFLARDFVFSPTARCTLLAHDIAGYHHLKARLIQEGKAGNFDGELGQVEEFVRECRQ